MTGTKTYAKATLALGLVLAITGFAVAAIPGAHAAPTRPLTKVVVRKAQRTAAGVNYATANCLPGERATGGGGQLAGVRYPLINSMPTVNAANVPIGWYVMTDGPNSHTVIAYVICASP